MPIKEESFLSPEADNWRKFHTGRNKDWFDCAAEINLVAQRFWNELPAVTDEASWKFAARLLYLRGLHSFQAAVILAGYGLTTDAGTLLRSTFEDLFCLAASKSDEALLARLTKAHHRSRRQLANALCALPPELSLGPPAIEKMRKFAATLPEEKQGLDFRAIAETGGLLPVYEVYYRSLSNDSAHPSLDALERLLKLTPSGDIEGIVDGPDVKDVPATMACACVVGFYLVATIGQLFENKAVHDATTNLFAEYHRLLLLTFPDRQPATTG